MAKVTIPCRRYYVDEMAEGDFQKFVENLHRFTDVKIQYYNALYDSKYNIEASEERLHGRTLTAWCKEKFGIGDYYIAAANQMASGQLSSQKELIKLYINDRKQEISEIEDKIAETQEDLDKKLLVKQTLIRYYRTGVFQKPYSKCSIQIVNGWLSGFRIELQRVETYERKVDRHIRQFKHRIKMLKLRLKKKQSRLEHLKNDVPKRILFGSKENYQKKDSSDMTDWRTDFMDRRYSMILFPGRHTSKYGNFLVKYNIHTNVLVVRMMDNTEITFPDFWMPRYEKEFLANFSAAPNERKAIGYQFLLRKDGKGRTFILPEVVLTLDEDVHVNHGFSTGCIAMDLNVDHVALADIDENGTLLHTHIIPFDFNGMTTGQTRCAIGNLMSEVGKMCQEQKKPLCMEDLDFKRKKAGVHYKKKSQNQRLSSFAYRKFTESAMTQGGKYAFAVYRTNPAYTSFIGKVKYMKIYSHIHIYSQKMYFTNR